MVLVRLLLPVRCTPLKSVRSHVHAKAGFAQSVPKFRSISGWQVWTDFFQTVPIFLSLLRFLHNSGHYFLKNDLCLMLCLLQAQKLLFLFVKSRDFSPQSQQSFIPLAAIWNVMSITLTIELTLIWIRRLGYQHLHYMYLPEQGVKV